MIEQADAAVIFGGDGTVHRNLPALVELQIPVLVVPCGSGNDFARALGIRSVRDAVNAWRVFNRQQMARAIDLGVIRELTASPLPLASPAEDERSEFTLPHYFCCVAGVGIDTAVARRANGFPAWLRRHGGYAISALREFFRFTPFPMKISVNGTQSAFQPIALAAIANAPAYGGGMKIAPQAALDDGRLDLCIVRGMDAYKLFCLFPAVYFGRHLGLREVEYSQTPVVRIETASACDIYADGEYVCQTPAEFTVAPRALKVIAFK